jgi:hypothetical protein
MTNLRERLRWWLAVQINKLPGQCWANLVSWALAGRNERRERYLRERLPWRRIDNVCRSDLARVGCCYCGTLRAAVAPTGPANQDCGVTNR